MTWREHANAPSSGTPLCRLDDIVDGAAREFAFGAVRPRFRLFVVRRGNAAYAYRNLCPHFGLALNVRPDSFLTRDGTRILCFAHYAQFRIEDGTCIGGPCEGRGLEPIPLDEIDGELRVA